LRPGHLVAGAAILEIGATLPISVGNRRRQELFNPRRAARAAAEEAPACSDLYPSRGLLQANQLTPIPEIEKIRSGFALKQVRYNTALPLPSAIRLQARHHKPIASGE